MNLNQALAKTIKASGDDKALKMANRISKKKIKQCPKCGHFYPESNEANHQKYAHKK